MSIGQHPPECRFVGFPEVSERNAVAWRVLAGIPFRSHPQSLHIWLDLPPGRGEDEFVAQARLRGVAVASGRAFRVNDHGRRDAVRVALGPTRTADLRHGLGVIADMLLSEPGEALLPLI